MNVYVGKHIGDWFAHCAEHRFHATCRSHEMALESAWGHLAVHHTKKDLNYRRERAVFDHLVNGCTNHRCDPNRPADFLNHLYAVAMVGR